MSQATKNTFSQSESLDDILLHLQIIGNGFSVDYKNKIQLLYRRLNGKTDGGSKEYILPLYQDYVQEKIDGFQGSYPDLNLEELYMGGISDTDFKGFNTQVEAINSLVGTETESSLINEACNELMQKYLTSTQEPITPSTTVSTTLKEVLGALKSGK